MNFFDDDFGLSSPTYPRKQAAPPATLSFENRKTGEQVEQVSRRSGKSMVKDEFDDLLDDMLSKEEKKINKKKDK